MIPLRRLLIVQSHDELPYPEGTACAEVLRATVGGSAASAWIFSGMAVGAAVKLPSRSPFSRPAACTRLLPVLPKAELALELAPALLGVGFILGYRQSAVLVAGSLISALVLTPLIALDRRGAVAPLFPETTQLIADMSAGEIWARYVRYIGAGAVAAAGIITVLRGLPTMAGAFVAVARGLREDARRAGPPARRRTPTATCRAASSSAAIVAGGGRRRARAGRLRRRHERRCSARSAPPGSASSASSSWPSPRASSASSASPRSRPRA